MLKIKDNVDLKELEKYGFVYFINGCRTYGYSYEALNGGYSIIIEKNNEFPNYPNKRKIPLNIPQDLLYDLIKDGLVEKVEDKDE
ncbi:MAG: hypothetical protein IJ501_06675 [Bacilli bacterium]|nr:hypothetical protein [Bacilli bacterium]